MKTIKNYTLTDLFGYCNITRQGHHQSLKSQVKWANLEYLIVGLILETREIHPGMGLRVIYDITKPKGLGRDAFINIGIKFGFRLIAYKNPVRTTFSSPYSRYQNLLVDVKLDNINQLWTSDITYFSIGEQHHYIVMIMDVYSRKIVGYSAADNMRAENNIKALEMAYKTRKKNKFNNLIHHSDRGGQYIDFDYTTMLTNAGIKISMCNMVYENANIERVNGTIKNQYLRYWNITTIDALNEKLKNTISAYNKTRPHSSLNGLTPDSFEQYIKELDSTQRPKLSVWTCKETKNINPNQCIIQF